MSSTPDRTTPDAGPAGEAASPAPTALLERMVAGKTRALLTFAGQGTDALGELAELTATSPQARALVGLASQHLDAWVAELPFRWSGLYGRGMPVAAWLADPQARPDAAYLASSTISQPLIFLSQMCRWASLLEAGLGGAVASGGVCAVTGHSQGMMAALLVAEGGAETIDTARFIQYLRYFVWQGYHMARSAGGALALGGEATPMAAISGADVTRIQSEVAALGEDPSGPVVIALHNTVQRLVVSGPASRLVQLRERLQAKADAEPKLKRQGKFAGKPMSFTWEWLAVGAPFHSPHMSAGLDAMRETVAAEGFAMRSDALKLNVYSPNTQRRYNDAVDLLDEIMTDQFVRSVNWPATLSAARLGAEIVLDLGPTDGVARLSRSALRGTGLEVVALSTADGRRRLLSPGAAAPVPATDWRATSPGLVRTPDGQVHIDNRYTRATGQSPIILPGMTPTTADAAICAAAANAGFTAELAGGGQVTEAIFTKRIGELKALLKPGQQVTFNALYLDPYLWDLQIRRGQLVQKARRNGAPIAGVTISAGIPPRDEAVRVLTDLHAAGLTLNAFKPGTAAQVDQVVQIARAVPGYTVLLHLEGGKAGGHHSWEDLEQLLIDTYALVRAEPNLVLCVGGGIATPERAAELLTGQWSRRFGLPDMPVDAVLLGTVAMACREATATPAVKAALAAAQGTSEWVLAGQVRGGVTSGRSQLDADIHYLDNAASRCGRLLDGVAGDGSAVAARRDEIVAALAQTAKPYFGDVETMTWSQLLERMVDLMAIGTGSPYEDGVWMDASWRQRVADAIWRAESRLGGAAGVTTAFSSVLQDLAELDQPAAALARLRERFADASQEVLLPADALWFVQEICGRPGKPVPFVPTIDADVRRWYKSDSLWQAQHPRFSADQVLVIPGPEAVAGVVADEPVADLLHRYDRGVVAALQAAGVVPRAAAERRGAPHLAQPDGLQWVRQGPVVELTADRDQDVTAWLAWAAQQYAGPLARFLGPVEVFCGGLHRPHPLRKLGILPKGTTLQLTGTPGGELQGVTLRLPGTPDCWRLATSEATVQVVLSLPGQAGAPTVHPTELRTEYALRDASSGAPWFEQQPQDAAVRSFYHRALFGREQPAVALFAECSAEVRVRAEQLAAFAPVTGASPAQRGVPLGLAFSLTWEPAFTVLSADELAGGLLNLVHLDQDIAVGPGWPPVAGELLQATARVTRVEDTDAGRTVHAQARLLRGGAAPTVCATLQSSYFIRGAFGETAWAVQAREPLSGRATLDAAAAAVLSDQPWWPRDAHLAEHTQLVWSGDAALRTQRRAATQWSVDLTVHIDGSPRTLTAQGASAAGVHPVTTLLGAIGGHAEAKSTGVGKRIAQLSDRTPAAMLAFAEVGGDLNPIHRSPAAARLAGLAAPIVHGMWTAARLASAVIEHAAGGDANRLSRIRVAFLAPAGLAQPIAAEVSRQGLHAGALRLQATARSAGGEDGQELVRLDAEVAPPKTAYLFPGQGIQQRGMGMDGYARSAAARAVWDRADAFTRRELGYSILQVVRDNPREVIVHGTCWRQPQGVLNLTQFTQVAMAVLAQAQVAELREGGALDDHAVACGHSVGEYNALAAYVGVLPLEAVVEIVWQRGLAMHALVPRDAHGRSRYAMGVIRPHNAGLDHAAAEALVAQVGKETGHFVQIVNYNVRGRQYSVTGELEALRRLEAVLNARSKAGKTAWLDVPGIDVPFHSHRLRDGVAAFREVLDRRLPQTLDATRLVGRYVPNLVPKAFSLHAEFVREVAEYTGSPQLHAALAELAAWQAKPDSLARLLVVELLAWQFASPVRWIETQELLALPVAQGGLGAVRWIEVGVGYQPTVANMAGQTLLGLGAAGQGITVLNAERDAQQLMALDADAQEPAAVAAEAPPPAPVAAPNAAASAPTAVSAGPATPVADAPVPVIDALKALLALQARVRPEQVRDTETIDELFDGVSSRRNQVLLDIGAEFDAGSVDGAHEKPIATLAAEVAKRAAAWRAPGRYLRGAIDEACKRLLGRAGMGRKEAAGYWAESWGLGEGLQAAALIELTLQGRGGESGRGGALGELPGDAAGSRAAALELLDKTAQLMGKRRSIVLAKKGGAAAQGQAVDAGAVRDLSARIDRALLGAAQALTDALLPPAAVGAAQGAEPNPLDVLAAELGADFAQLVQPAFDAKKHVVFGSTWAFAQRDVARLYTEGVAGRLTGAPQQREAARLAAHAADPRVAATAKWYHRLAAGNGHSELAAALAVVADGAAAVPAYVAPTAPQLRLSANGSLSYREVPRAGAADLSGWLGGLLQPGPGQVTVPPVVADTWRQGSAVPLDFSGRTALVSGASPGSIALQIVRHLLRGGATVVVTTSTWDKKRLLAWRRLWQAEAAPGAELHVVPCNMASWRDIAALVQWLFGEVTEPAGAQVRVIKRPMAPDILVPFAAIKDLATLDTLGPKAEVAVRVMLLGVERLVGAIGARYRAQGAPSRPCHVLLPLSPNHGTFGGDGAYAETKAGLEAMLAKWHSERDAWAAATTLCGARIGWVRGTGLMDANDPVAARLEEKTGVRTFSSAEMGFLLAGLCAGPVCDAARHGPLDIDLTGGFGSLADVRGIVDGIRRELDSQVQVARRQEQLRKHVPAAAQGGVVVQPLAPWPPRAAQSQLRRPWPSNQADLHDMVVIVGIGEVGPCGSARTRFELEVGDTLSAAGVLELAWTTGLVRWQNGSRGSGWVDAQSGESVDESQLVERYGKAVRERVGIRWVDEATAGFDPRKLPVHTSVFLDRDFTFVVGGRQEADEFLAADPGHTRTAYDAESDQWRVTRTAGAEVRVLRQVRLDRAVAGLIPTGWDATRFGIPKDMADNLDRVTLFNLVATVDAFAAAGLSPEELLAHIHPARVGNTQGGGIGGMRSLHRLYLDHVLGRPRQTDILQETLINVVAAYAVQSYVGSYGTMAHPVGACATAAVSVEEAFDKLTCGRVDFVVAGGYDDYGQEGAVGFSDMAATASSDEMTAMGLDPEQMSRANDVRRRGFVEGQGGGTALLTRGEVALRLGLPVYGVIGYAGSFGDGIHKSIPAPGMGALAAAMGGTDSPLGRALARHGLAADDIGVVYKHDTSTGANDPNENALHHRIQTALGRTPGNPLWAVSQKTLTGHSKGGAAAWQLAGLCQSLSAGVVPGNRNLDSVDEAMRRYSHIGFTDATLTGMDLRAGLVTSLGFGHVGALLLVLHPDAFLSRVPAAERSAYLQSVQDRLARQRRDRALVWMGQKTAYDKRSHRRFDAADGSDEQTEAEARMLLDPAARLGSDGRYRQAGGQPS